MISDDDLDQFLADSEPLCLRGDEHEWRAVHLISNVHRCPCGAWRYEDTQTGTVGIARSFAEACARAVGRAT